MHGVLGITIPHWERPLSYATQILLDSMGVDAQFSVEHVPGEPGGLTLDNRWVLGQSELMRVFRAVSLQRELETARKDSLGRFAENAIAWNTGTPWVDLRAKDAAEVLQHAPVQTRGGFQVVLTHDIDHTTVFEPTCLLKALLPAKAATRRLRIPLRSALQYRSLYRTMERLLEFETRHHIGACYFMMSGPYGLGRFSTRTDIRWRISREIVKLLQAAGMTIGLHGSFAARDANTYREERERLEQVVERAVIAHRNHYLRFDTEQLCAHLRSAGLRYDFSIGFVSRLGFRAGTGKAYRLYNFAEAQTADLLEVPLLFMDSVLRQRDWEQVFTELRAALQAAKEIQGCVALVFHPESFLAQPEMWTFFERVIGLCEELGADLSGQLPFLAEQMGRPTCFQSRQPLPLEFGA